MKLTFNTIRTCVVAITALCLAVASASCVRDDIVECPPEEQTLRLSMSYLPTDIVLASEDLHLAVVYVYDSQGRVFDVWSVAEPDFGTVYDTGIVLGDDDYRLVAWLDPDNPYSLTPAWASAVGSGINMADSRLALTIPESGYVTEKLPWLLYGDVDNISVESTSSVVNIPLELDNYVIDLVVTGIPQDRNVYTFMIMDNNGIYDFNNDFAGGNEFFYSTMATFSTPVRVDENVVLAASLTTLRIAHGRSPEIDLTNTTANKKVYPTREEHIADLVELIEETIPDNDFSKTHEYEIRLDFDENSTSVRLFVNGWELKMEDYEI